MLYRKLGQTDLNVSVVCQGTWSVATKDAFWDGQDRGDSLAAIRAGLDAGVNFFDTAPAYGNGESEEILGEALGSHRGEVIVATKVAPTDLEPDKLRQSCERSLRALRSDYIDLYQIHWPSKTLPLEPAWRTLEALRREGKIRHIGVSNFGRSFLGEVSQLGRAESNQLPYSLIWRAVEFDIQPLCVANEMGILCYSPLAQGLLTGKFQTAGEVPEKRARTRLFSASRKMTRHGEPGFEQETFAALADIRRVSDELGQPMGRVALAWLLAQPGVTSAIVGARNAAQAIENAAAAELRLDADVIARLSAITEPLKHKLGSNADPWEHVSRMEKP
ncbi:MAG: aldo/keto reductase [Verrucomicrobia bacterium]|nr:aldo/keto reductase [Verrucomicrobiota bacterium]